MITTQVSGTASTTFRSQTDPSGAWAFQIDTGSLSIGYHTAKAYFELSTSTKSGYGKAVNFYVGTGTGACAPSIGDLNGDKKVNLVDFSIMLTVLGDCGCPGRS
jgi:hypothetical protein